MKKQAFNPYLPDWEYVPDGEPHVFDDRVYVYGTHDRFGAPILCVNDYVCWSAPLDDLSDWRYEGVIYKKSRIRPTRQDFAACMLRMRQFCLTRSLPQASIHTRVPSWHFWA